MKLIFFYMILSKFTGSFASKQVVLEGDSTHITIEQPRNPAFDKIRIETNTTVPNTTTVWTPKKCERAASKCNWSSPVLSCEFKQLYDYTTYFVMEHFCFGHTRAMCDKMTTDSAKCAMETIDVVSLRECFTKKTFVNGGDRAVLAFLDVGSPIAWSFTGMSWAAIVSNAVDKRIQLFVYNKQLTDSFFR